jgi:hypothetical protein
MCVHQKESTLLAKGAIEQWTHGYPDFVSAHADQRQAWVQYCNGYTLLGYIPQGSRLRSADEYMFTAVANIYACKLGVTKYEPFKGIAYCTIHLAFYSASA